MKARQAGERAVARPGYGLAYPVVRAQMQGQALPHVERQAGDHWEMEPDFGSGNGAPE